MQKSHKSARYGVTIINDTKPSKNPPKRYSPWETPEKEDKCFNCDIPDELCNGDCPNIDFMSGKFESIAQLTFYRKYLIYEMKLIGAKNSEIKKATKEIIINAIENKKHPRDLAQELVGL